MSHLLYLIAERPTENHELEDGPSFTEQMSAALKEQFEQTDGHEVRVVNLNDIDWELIGGAGDFVRRVDVDNFDYQLEQKSSIASHEHETFADDVKEMIENILWADYLFFHFPMTNFSFPARMKGVIDRCYAYHMAYGGLHSLSPRKALFITKTASQMAKSDVERYFHHMYQSQKYAGVRNLASFFYSEEDEDTLQLFLDHVTGLFGWKSRFRQAFSFPRISALTSVLFGK